MGFVGDVLGKVYGIQWYYIIGLFIIIALFAVIVYRTIKTPKADLLNYKTSILDNDGEVNKI